MEEYPTPYRTKLISEEIIWVYIPESWMEMSKDAYRALGEAGYLAYYTALDEELVSQVLAKFKPVLEELS